MKDDLCRSQESMEQSRREKQFGKDEGQRRYQGVCRGFLGAAQPADAKIDKPQNYYLETHGPAYRNRPMLFAAVRAGKGYVSYHLMPVYA
jgi:hypothetical protein